MNRRTFGDFARKVQSVGTCLLCMVSPHCALIAKEPVPQYTVSELQRSFDLGDAPAMAPDGTPQPRLGATRGFSLARPKVPQTRDLLITFSNGSAQLTAQAIANAKVVAEALTSEKLLNSRFAIDGHTNSIGSRSYNLQLSIARADALANLLVGLGVQRSRLETNGFGFDRPVDTANPMSGINRRVEARILK